MAPTNTIPALERGTARLADLRPAPYNPRRITPEAKRGLSASLQRFGVVQEVVVNRRTGNIVGGHQRVDALRGNGVDEVPVVWVDLPPEEERALNVALNNPHIAGEWDETLGALLAEIERDTPVAFEELQLGKLVDDAPATSIRDTDEDDAPEVRLGEPVSKRGEVYELGPHRLMCGDSCSVTDVAALMVGKLADCVWTDPPYGVAYVGKTADALTIENDTLDDDGLEKLLRDALGAAFASSRDGAAWYVAAAPGPLHHCFAAVLKDLGIWRQTINWVKSVMVLGRSDYHYQHEPIFYGWKPGAAHKWTSDRKQTTTLNFDKPARNGEHPTMKPVALVAYCVGNNTDKGDTVLDPFGGSGTTLIACAETGRAARLMEIDPRYCDVIRRRWTRWAKEHNQDPGPGALEDANA